MKAEAMSPRAADRPPFTSILFTLLGVVNMAIAVFPYLLLTVLLKQILEEIDPMILNLIVIAACVACVFSGLTCFAIARILGDLHAIRVNTEAYEISRDREDFRANIHAAEYLARRIEGIVSNACKTAQVEDETDYDETNDSFEEDTDY